MVRMHDHISTCEYSKQAVCLCVEHAVMAHDDLFSKEKAKKSVEGSPRDLLAASTERCRRS